MTGKINKLRIKLEQEKGRKSQLESIIASKNDKLKLLEQKQIDIDEARELSRIVAQETQKQLEYRISSIVALALSAVFDDPYDFGIEFVLKRNKTECELFFIRNGERLKPIGSSGVGAVDVAAFALRVAMLTLERPRKRKVMILDEPFKHLRGKLRQQRCSAMVKEISEKLGLQIIMVGDVAFTMDADRIFDISITKKLRGHGVSEVEVIDG